MVFAQNRCLTTITLLRGPNMIIWSHVLCQVHHPFNTENLNDYFWYNDNLIRLYQCWASNFRLICNQSYRKLHTWWYQMTANTKKFNFKLIFSISKRLYDLKVSIKKKDALLRLARFNSIWSRIWNQNSLVSISWYSDGKLFAVCCENKPWPYWHPHCSVYRYTIHCRR